MNTDRKISVMKGLFPLAVGIVAFPLLQNHKADLENTVRTLEPIVLATADINNDGRINYNEAKEVRDTIEVGTHQIGMLHLSVFEASKYLDKKGVKYSVKMPAFADREPGCVGDQYRPGIIRFEVLD